MELSLLALQAMNIALYAIDKTSGGALEKAGADVLDFLTRRFRDKIQIKQSNSELLKAAIISESELDRKFQEDLAKLIEQFNKAEAASVSQSSTSNVNVNVGNNSGTVIGQQQIGQQFFR